MEKILNSNLTLYDLFLIGLMCLIARLTFAFIKGFIQGIKNSIQKIKNQK